MSRSKMSREDLMASYEAADRSLAATRIALKDVLAGDVQWFDHHACDGQVGLVRPTSASGGVVIVVLDGDPRVQYLDSWVSDLRHKAEIIGGDYHDWVELADRVLEARRDAIQAEVRCAPGGPLPG